MEYNEYKALLLSNKDTPRNIMGKIKMPSSVFKYRCFVREKDTIIEEDPYWRESMEGIVFFSLAKDFNSNDLKDCVLFYDKEKIRNQVHNVLKSTVKSDKIVDAYMEPYIASIRDNFRIGCFTTKSVDDKYMWGKKEFGGNHTGYCIEYDAIEQMIYPNTIIFLPVLYESITYDSTPVFLSLIKNGGIKSNELEIASLGYNFALFKNLQFKDENEWRIIVAKNKYNSYFERDNCKKDYSNIMKAIYLGSRYQKYDENGEKYKYALNICRSKKIPLYEMCEENGKLYKKCTYKP